MDIINIRLANQRLAETKLETPVQVVTHMGAMQAQDFGMACWGVGVRMAGAATLSGVMEAFDKGEILRTHVLRPTWHLVTAADLRRVLTLTAPRIKTACRAWNIHVGLTDSHFTRSRDIIERELEGGKHLTREEIGLRLIEAGIISDPQHTRNIMMMAELNALVCSGAMRGKHTYALFDERVPDDGVYDRDDAMERLARSYFTSHSPATLADFAWWSGLSLTDARRAVAMLQTDFRSVETDAGSYIVGREALDIAMTDTGAHLLPAFDEFMVSYKERAHIIPAAHYDKAISKNGIFRPTIMVGGKAVGLWQKVAKGKKTAVETDYFEPSDKATQKQVELAAQSVCRFYNDEA